MLLQKITYRKILSSMFFYMLAACIAAVFAFPLFYVIGNSFRDSQAIWSNAFPFSLKTFFTFKDFNPERRDCPKSFHLICILDISYYFELGCKYFLCILFCSSTISKKENFIGDGSRDNDDSSTSSDCPSIFCC